MREIIWRSDLVSSELLGHRLPVEEELFKRFVWIDKNYHESGTDWVRIGKRTEEGVVVHLVSERK